MPARALPSQRRAASALSKWQAGTNYKLLPAPQPTSVAAGKVEVDEVFWYGCGHCYALDPALESWKARKAALRGVRAGSGHLGSGAPATRQALSTRCRRCAGPSCMPRCSTPSTSRAWRFPRADEVEARALQFAFLNREGVTDKEFNAAYDSMSVASNVLRAEEFTKKFAVANVPVMVVNGKYITSVSEAGSEAKLIALINDLAASEKAR